MRLLLVLVTLLIGTAGPRPEVARADAKRPLRVMTYNVNWANPDPESALDAIARADVDVVLLQEVTAEWKRLLVKRFDKQYPHATYHLHRRAAGGLAVLSKLPIQTDQVFASPARGWFPAGRIVLQAPFGALQVLHVHLRPAIDGGSWLKGYLTTPPLRLREITSYWKHVDPKLPTLVAGDFNEEPTTGRAVRFLEQQGLRRVPTKGPTTWRYRAMGRGTTSEMLRLDIDHVMVDKRLTARDGVVLDEGRSDHRPVIVTIEPKS